MATQTLHFESARQAQQLFNNEPKNLQAVEQELGVKATCRDGWIKLDGNDQSVLCVQKLFELMESALRAGTPIRNQEFAQSIAVIKEHGADTLRQLLEDRIRTSSRKAPISPKTAGQKAYLEAIRKCDVTFGIGPAGTGKTYLALAMAVSCLKANTVARILLTRPAVEAGEALGFLPGDLYEKLEPYLRPLHDALHDMLPAEEIQRHMDRGTIEIAPLAYMRGRTLNHSFIILDEAQNATAEQNVYVPHAAGNELPNRGHRRPHPNRLAAAKTLGTQGSPNRAEKNSRHRNRRVPQTRRHPPSLGEKNHRRLRRPPQNRDKAVTKPILSRLRTEIPPQKPPKPPPPKPRPKQRRTQRILPCPPSRNPPICPQKRFGV